MQPSSGQHRTGVRARWFGAILAITTLEAGLMATGVAYGQAASPSSPDPEAATTSNAAEPLLQDVVVTATRQTLTEDTVPLSITALSQAGLEQQDIRSLQDLSRAVPGLQVSDPNNANGESISIRGISSPVSSSPTTGVYLNDIPLQELTVPGADTGSGTPLPQLYDMDRVEVLRGPQGTLYGEGTEGGAVRFITPTPSLNNYTGTARAELSDTYDGGINYEEGAAYGGPIIPGTLGFRASLWGRSDSGYIDHVYAYTGQTLGSDTNSEDRWQGNLSLLWAPTDALNITAALYIAFDHFADSDSFTSGEDGPVIPAFTVPATASGNPAHTFGPFSYGPYKTIVNCNIGQNYINEIAPCYEPSPRTDRMTLPSLSIDYDLGGFTLHSATGFLTDDGSGVAYDGFGDVGGVNGGVPLLYNFPEFSSNLAYFDLRSSFTEELRAASKPDTGPWTWVGGVFYSRQFIHAWSADYAESADMYNNMIEYTKDTTLLAAYGAPTNAAGLITDRNQTVTETEYATFGQANYAFTRHLTGILGLRLARDDLDYDSYLQGPFFGYEVPTYANGGLTSGSQAADMLLPKASIEYQFSPTQLLYASASKGERDGGVNTGAYTTKCQSTFAEDGITGTPATFKPDSLWDYELGAKLGVLDGRAQVNADVFYINWSNVQTNFALPSPCGFSYTSNAGGALSKGAELQAQWAILRSLVASVNYSYTDAYYVNAVTGPAPTYKPFILKGDTLPVPPDSLDVVLSYQPPVWQVHSPFISATYQYTSPYKDHFGPGSSGYDDETYVASETRFVTAKIGAFFGKVQVTILADNLFNSQDLLTRSGGPSCSNAACTVVGSYDPIFTDSTFRPRTIGLNASLRF